MNRNNFRFVLEEILKAGNLPRKLLPEGFHNLLPPDQVSLHLHFHLSRSRWELFGHLRWLHNQFLPFFSVPHCPLGLGELQACPFPDLIFPPLPLFVFSSPFHHALQDVFCQTWWTGDMSILLLFVSLTMVWRSPCGLIACWIFAQTSLLVSFKQIFAWFDCSCFHSSTRKVQHYLFWRFCVQSAFLFCSIVLL